MKFKKFVQKLLSSITLLSMCFIFSNVIVKEANAYTREVFCLKIKGKGYCPERSESYPDEQNRLMEKIVAAKEYDNMMAKKYQENESLVPFLDFHKEYGQVFKNNDVYLEEIVVNRNYNFKILDAYLDYYQNMINNFEKNRALYIKRHRDDSEDGHLILKNMDKMYKKLIAQQEDQTIYFNHLNNLRGL